MQQFIQEEIIKVQSRGLVTLPKNLRQKLGLGKDSLVRVKEEKGRLVIEPVRILPYTVRSYTEDEVKGFIGLDKQETKALREKGLL